MDHSHHNHHKGHDMTKMMDQSHVMVTDMKMDMDNSSMDMGMQMYFETGYNATVLFAPWVIDSVGKMVGSCIGIFFMAVLYEGLKYFRERLQRKDFTVVDYTPQGNGHANQTRKTVSFKSSLSSPSHMTQTVLHLVQLVLSYFLMLIVMTYNVWLFISVILGCTFGYFLFGWQKAFLVDITEHCH